MAASFSQAGPGPGRFLVRCSGCSSRGEQCQGISVFFISQLNFSINHCIVSLHFGLFNKSVEFFYKQLYCGVRQTWCTLAFLASFSRGFFELTRCGGFEPARGRLRRAFPAFRWLSVESKVFVRALFFFGGAVVLLWHVLFFYMQPYFGAYIFFLHFFVLQSWTMCLRRFAHVSWTCVKFVGRVMGGGKCERAAPIEKMCTENMNCLAMHAV